MKLAGEQLLPAPRERVWQLLNDPARLARLVPGCEKLEARSPEEFTGTLNVGIAAVKGVYTGTVKLAELRPPEHYRMTVDGKGRQGFMRGSGVLDLLPRGNGQTVLKYSGDVQIGGLLVQVGQRVIDSAAKMMMGQFFAALEAELKAEAEQRVARQGFFINLWRYLWSVLRSFWRRRGGTPGA
jgi:uncharacterized protein